MKKIIFTIASRRLEVDLKDEFAEYLSKDLIRNKVTLDKDNDITHLLQLYLKALKREFDTEEHIKTLLNQIEGSS